MRDCATTTTTPRWRCTTQFHTLKHFTKQRATTGLLNKQNITSLLYALSTCKNNPRTKTQFFLSAPIQNALKNTQPTDRVVLFIHRRGLYSALVCRQCGDIPYCDQCSRPLIQHASQLVCHICSQTKPAPLRCSKCGATHIKPLGGGTELVEKMLKKTFPNLSVARLDYDTAPTLRKTNRNCGQLHSKQNKHFNWNSGDVQHPKPSAIFVGWRCYVGHNP